MYTNEWHMCCHESVHMCMYRLQSPNKRRKHDIHVHIVSLILPSSLHVPRLDIKGFIMYAKTHMSVWMHTCTFILGYKG